MYQDGWIERIKIFQFQSTVPGPSVYIFIFQGGSLAFAAILLVTIVVAREPGIQAAIERLLNPQVNLRKTPEVIRFDPPTIVTTPAIGMYTSILNKQIPLETFFL